MHINIKKVPLITTLMTKRQGDNLTFFARMSTGILVGFLSVSNKISNHEKSTSSRTAIRVRNLKREKEKIAKKFLNVKKSTDVKRNITYKVRVDRNFF